MRYPIRSLAPLLLGVGVATCSDAPTVAGARGATTTEGRIAVGAVFSKSAAAAYAQRATFAALSFDHVRIVLVRPPSDTVKDTTITFTPGSPPQTVQLIVSVTATNEAFNGEIDYTNNGVTVYQATARLISHPTDEPVTPQEIVAVYVGPGATATKLTVAPKTISVVSPGGASFTASATDANNATVSGVPVSWTSSDPSVATIDAGTGALATTGKRGTTTVTASAPTKTGVITDNASVTVTLPPASITLVSGGGQTGKAGTALSAPAVVRVLAADGQGVAGITVNFAPPNGGKVGSASATTDANGNASSSLTLGGTAGPQSFAAAAANFSVSIPATATPGDPAAIVAVSGGGQQDTVKHPLKAPFVAKVTDAFANAVPGITVSWARSAGTGALAATSSVTGADGSASVGYTLGATPGAETVTASVSGVTTPASFTATALSSGPAAVVAVSGGGQVGRIGQPLAAPFVVRVTDDAGQGVAGVSVAWSATNGTISPTTTTDAQGSTSNTLTLGNTVGPASAVATITTATTPKTVTFSASAQAGIVARLVFRAPPANGSPGVALAPVQVELRDAAGNLTAAANAVTIALGANPGQATLGGTLTRTSAGGVATFNDLSINVAAIGYTLVASSAGIPSVTSTPFNVGAGGGAAQGMIFATAPPTTAATDTPLGTIVIQMIDGNERPVGAQGIAVTVGVRADPNCETCFQTPLAALTGTLTVTTDASGKATFPNLVLSGQSQEDDLTFDATVGGVALPTLVAGPIELAGPPQGVSITATGPRVFSVVFGQSFPAYPIAHVTDAFGKPVAGVTVDFTAGGTGCDTDDSTVPVVTNASGDAALTPSLLPFTPAIPASCVIFAESNGISDIETWSLVLRPAGTVAWTGITSADWLDGTNWTPAAPQNTDVVFIPSDVWTVATLSTGTTVGGVTMQSNSGAIINLDAWPLTINGDFDGGVIGQLFTQTTGSVLLNKAGAGTWSGTITAPVTVGTPTCTGGTSYTLGISVTVSSLTTNCPIDVNDFFLIVNNDLVVQTSGKIILNQVGSLIQAQNMTFQGVSGAGSMTSGHISLRGNLTVSSTMSVDPLVLGPANQFDIAGVGAHTLSWGPNVTPSMGIVAVDAGTGPVTFTASNAIPVSGTFFTGSTSLTIPAGVTMNVSGAATFYTNSSTTVLGTLTVGPNSVFISSSSVTGSGIMSATLPCTKGANAAVNVGSGPAPFTAAGCSPGP